MPKKTAKDEAEYFMLRLPKEYQTLLRKMKRLTLRNFTFDTQIALERFARDLGIEFKPNYPTHLSVPRPGGTAGPA